MLFGLRVVMLGRQGSGKGTQGMQLARLLVVPRISVGDLLHEASRSGSLADSGPGECTAGMSNLQILVPPEAQVSIQVVNAEPDTAHGLVITGSGAASTWMPMMTARPAFPARPCGSSATRLRPGCAPGRSPSPPAPGEPTGTRAGPRPCAEGMVGRFTVR